jgi:8-oxo-dGTP pyrophosphatase MutT (NUDIX family)
MGDNERPMNEPSLFETPWFRVIARGQPDRQPYYMLQLADYVSVIALTSQHEMLLVKQHRPVVERETLELPSGHLERGESPEAAARRELLEETGHVAGQLELLGTLVPDVGRLANRMWCYFAADVRPSAVRHEREEGVSLVLLPARDALRAALDGTIDHALNLAPLFLARATGRFGTMPADLR